MRVRQPDDNVGVVLKDNNDSIIANFKKEIVTPGSMITLSVPVKLFSDDLDTIEVSISK